MNLLLLLLTAFASFVCADFYGQSSSVTALNNKNFKKSISDSLAIVEFYAPWCGYCKQLAPEYLKASKKLNNIAKVAAINCDEERNKPTCGRFQVQGFPTLKIFNRGKFVEDYQGPRTAKGIVEYMNRKVVSSSNVKFVNSPKAIEKWKMEKQNNVVLLPAKDGDVPLLFRSISLLYNPKTTGFTFVKSALVSKYIEKYGKDVEINQEGSTLLVINSDETVVKFNGEMKREAIVKFLNKTIKTSSKDEL